MAYIFILPLSSMAWWMDQTYFIQKAAIAIYAQNASMDVAWVWEKAQRLYDAGEKKWFFSEKTNFRKDRENDPERTDYRYPRNMHVRWEIQEDVPF